MNNLFEGKLIRLRAYEPDDVEIMRRHLLDTEISRSDSEIDWPWARSHVERSVEKKGQHKEEYDGKSLAIETLDGKLVGGLSVGKADRVNGTFSIGLGIADRSEWGKGYAKEAMLLAMRYMFHERRYQKCNLGVYAFNERAIGLYRRLGFVEEGRLRRSYFTAGQYVDEVLMGMTREEFDSQWPEYRCDLT
jgi:RimJ/RimL family protein N-acetyltransferase